MRVCGAALAGECVSAPGACARYHLYLRPSTEDIIRRVYPVRTGATARVLPSGVVEYRGNVARGGFSGFGVMTWRGDSVYVGNWWAGRRHGLGMLLAYLED